MLAGRHGRVELRLEHGFWQLDEQLCADGAHKRRGVRPHSTCGRSNVLCGQLRGRPAHGARVRARSRKRARTGRRVCRSGQAALAVLLAERGAVRGGHLAARAIVDDWRDSGDVRGGGCDRCRAHRRIASRRRCLRSRRPDGDQLPKPCRVPGAQRPHCRIRELDRACAVCRDHDRAAVWAL
eukprot:Amastigsp_a509678_70.p3 type:complete len:182 gc:universal Amastigsp_a509678_70:243-788(+)